MQRASLSLLPSGGAVATVTFAACALAALAAMAGAVRLSRRLRLRRLRRFAHGCCCGGAIALCVLVAYVAGSVAPAVAVTQEAGRVERSVKAAFLYKFLGYVEFAQADGDGAAPLVIGVQGADAFAAELARVTAGRSVGGRAVDVRALRDGDGLAGVNVLFVGRADGDSAALLRAAQREAILTVTEADNGMPSGSVINFVLVDERVRFEVSLAAAEKNRVKLSSRLLSVAYRVHKGAR